MATSCSGAPLRRAPDGSVAIGPVTTLGEITEVDENRDEAELPPSAPFAVKRSVNLDGVDWLLTTLVLIIDALLMELHRTGYTRWATFLTWFADPDFSGGWSGKLSETLFVLVVAVVNVSVIFPILNLNVRTPSTSSWRFWLLSSWASLILLNAMTTLQFADAIVNAAGDEDVSYWVSHFFLVCTVVVLTLLLDVRYVMLYGFLTFLTCQEDRTLGFWNGLRPIAGKRLKMDRVRLRDILNFKKLFYDTMKHGHGKFDWKKGGGATFNFVESTAENARRLRIRQRADREIGPTSRQGPIMGMPTEEVEGLVDEMLKYKSRFYWNTCRQKLLSWFDAVAEAPGIFQYSSWMKASIGFTVVMILYNCIKAIEMLFALDTVFDAGHEAVTDLTEDIETVDGQIEDLAASLEAIDTYSTPEALYYMVNPVVQELAALNSSISAFVPTDLDTQDYATAAAIMHISLIRATALVELGDFDTSEVISAFYYTDTYVNWLKWASLIGYPLGTAIGLYSLYQVMKQHKQMSMGLAHEQHIQSTRVVRKHGDTRTEVTGGVMGLENKYPIAGAVYFIGVLASTAVVQTHTFGMLTTLILAFVFNLDKFDIFLDLGGYLILIYVIILLVNLGVSHLVGDRLLTQQNFRIRYPWPFFLFLFVFSIIHAVLGFFYALWRALLLLITTVWVLNRLDVSLFQAGKRLDNGHYSFMSMLLLTHIIRLENEQKARAGDHTVPLAHASESVAAALMSQASVAPV